MTKKELINAMADNNLNISQAAKAMKYSRNSVIYHRQKIIDETGLDVANFWDLTELIKRMGDAKE